MTHTVDAIFAGGSFKPDQPNQLNLSDGQRVTLTIKTISQDRPLPALSDGPRGSVDQAPWAQLERQTLNQQLSSSSELGKLAASLGISDSSPRDFQLPQTIKIPDEKETFENWWAPRPVVDAIKEQFKGIVTEVSNIRPTEPKNRAQTFTRAALAYFNNVSSLLVYLILISATLKLIFLFAAHNAKIVQAIDNAKYTLTPLALIVVLICLLTVRGLHRISGFVRSYRVMSILGCAIAIKLMIKTSIVLFTATSFTNMGAAAWQLFSGALK